MNPVWDEYFEFVMEAASRPLILTVKDDDRVGKNQELGRAEMMSGDLQFAPDTVGNMSLESWVPNKD